ncbi:cytochrome P450 CYP72A616 [Aegilops tauschii subsp. strangulata]|nr:cytochrome P450 72A14 [Aegilops tauschii subsp. strangulata]
MATSVVEDSFPWEQQPLVHVYAVAGTVLAWCAVRALEWAWWRPRRLERELRAQGLRGRAYHSVAGDAPFMERLHKEARSRTMPLGSHDVVPRAMPLFHQTIMEHGKLSITWFGPVPRVTITEPELVREVLSNKLGHLEKLNLGRLQRMLHHGVGSHEGEKWAKHRKIITPAFHLEKLKRMLPAFATCCTELVHRWEVLAAGDAPCEVDVWPDMKNLTGDVISRAAFGSSYHEGRKVFQLQGEQIELIVQAMDKMHIPGYLFLPTKGNRRMNQIVAEIERVLKGIIAKREKALKAGEATSGDDLLGLLLESNIAHCRPGDAGAGITTEDLIGECKLFYFAGMETTSLLLTWTMIVLCMHPDWQDRAREEVMHVFAHGTTPDYDSLTRLKIVTMVLYEVLRLYTPLTSVHRKTCKPMDLGGVRYPAGMLFMVPFLCLHHDKDVWGADADEFRPERFANGISKAGASADAPAFFPFGWGQRTCVGQSFAMLEAKMGIAMILQRFSFELSPSYTHAPFPIGLLHPEHGAQLMLTRLP